jgi:hypothetical protein
MSITLTEISECDSAIFRNIQGAPPEFDEFDDLTTDTAAKSFAHRSTSKIHTLQYHAIDFIFSQTSWNPTRFGDGSHPVWYGSTHLDTSFHETLYHWYRIFIQAPATFKDGLTEPTKVIRTVYSVECTAALIDLRKKHTEAPELIQPNPANYRATQQIGLRIYKEGYPGLMTKSARSKAGDNIAVFKKTILSNPKFYDHYCYEYDFNSNETRVINQRTNKVELTTMCP